MNSDTPPITSGTPRARPRVSFRVALGLIAAVALALRLVLLYRARSWSCELCDSNYYSLQANDLAKGKWFLEPFGWNLKHIVKPSAAHPPLMSLYLALWSLFGFTSFLAHRVAACILGAVAVAVIGLAAKRVTASRHAGLIAAGIAACYPNLWMNDLNLQAESIFILTIAVVIERSYAFWHESSRKNAVLLGLAIALSALARAEGLLFFALVLIPLAVRLKERSWREKATCVLLAGVAGGALMAPWVGYNLSRFANPVYLSVGSGYVMELGNCDTTYDRSSNYYAYWTYECDRDPQEHGRAEKIRNRVDESAGEIIRRERAVAYIKDHIAEYPVVVVFRTLRVLDFFRPGDNVRLNSLVESRDQEYGWTALWMYYTLTALALVGLSDLIRKKITVIPFAAVLISVGITMAIAFGITRYRVGWDVALCVLGAIGIQSLRERFSGERST
ncbi:MAG: glycosyltransferase family 39 protein [Acidimicrobiia bacterium]